MKALRFTSFEDRIEKVRKQNKKLCEFHSEAQKMIDCIRFSSWLVYHETAVVDVYVNTEWYNRGVTFHISNVLVDEFIERILGPIHRQTNTFWKMEIAGDENEPVFAFDEIDKDYDLSYSFRVKEGDFKQCSVVKKVIGFSEVIEPEPRHRLVLECT